MKLVNTTLQTQMEQLSPKKSTDFFKAYLQSLLEDPTKPYYKRADYIGLSLNELKLKIDHLTEDIQALQQLKKQISSALTIAKEVTAELLTENGIDRIDGNIISSLTLMPASTSSKQQVAIIDEDALMELGYIKYEVDTEAIEKALQDEAKQKQIKPYLSITQTITTTPAKVKVNLKRSSTNQADKLVERVDNAA